MSNDWELYQACTQVCGAPMSQPCLQLSGYVAAGDVRIAVEADVPHSPRKLRAAAARDAQFGRVIDRG